MYRKAKLLRQSIPFLFSDAQHKSTCGYMLKDFRKNIIYLLPFAFLKYFWVNQSFFKASQAHKCKFRIFQQRCKQNEPILLLLGHFLVSGSLFSSVFDLVQSCNNKFAFYKAFNWINSVPPLPFFPILNIFTAKLQFSLQSFNLQKLSSGGCKKIQPNPLLPFFSPISQKKKKVDS